MSLKPLKLGNRTFPTNLIQGPLAGISCSPFRELIWRYSQPAFTYTEMISCKTILHQPKLALQRFIAKSKHEGSVCVQLSSAEPQELAAACKYVTDNGADLIDLNCGCPVKKIRSKGAGSRLLTEPAKLYRLIHAMKQNTHLPVSIKIRVEGKSDECFNQELVKVVSEAGADFLVVHGRHWTEHYETPCRHDQIQFFVEQLKIPVIGNGDIRDVASLRQMLNTGCAGVMIGRAGVGQPWLIAQLMAEFSGLPFLKPSQNEIFKLFLEHIEALAQLLGSETLALLQARKLVKYYARDLNDKSELIRWVNDCESLQKLSDVIARF